MSVGGGSVVETLPCRASVISPLAGYERTEGLVCALNRRASANPLRFFSSEYERLSYEVLKT